MDVDKNHVDLSLIEECLRNKIYPNKVVGKGDRANFRRASKTFSIVDGRFMYKEKRLAITNKNERINIIHDIRQELSENAKAQAMRSHFGRTPTIDNIRKIIQL